MTRAEHNRIFERWIGEHKGLVFKVVHASMATPEDRNDLFQEIAIQIWKSVPSFKGDSKESTWIFRVALNTAAVWSRKESRHRSRVESREDLEGILMQESRHRNDQLMLGFVPPSVAALLLTGVFFRMTGITGRALLPVLTLLLVNLVLETRSQQRLVDNELVPRLRDLESLRDKLSSL